MSDLTWWIKQTLHYSPRVHRKWQRVDLRTALSRFSVEQSQRYQSLMQRYDISAWPQYCTESEFQENLYLLDVLDAYVPTTDMPKGKAIDIGCRNFCHLPALFAFFPATWTGVEVDAHARYKNGYTRRAYGEYMAAQFPGARYRAQSFMQIQEQYQLMVWLLPFLFWGTQQVWGLPKRFFAPRDMLLKALSSLAPQGLLFIVNQGKDEAQYQERLLKECDASYQDLDEIHSVFSPFKKKRFAWCVKGVG